MRKGDIVKKSFDNCIGIILVEVDNNWVKVMWSNPVKIELYPRTHLKKLIIFDVFI